MNTQNSAKRRSWWQDGGSLSSSPRPAHGQLTPCPEQDEGNFLACQHDLEEVVREMKDGGVSTMPRSGELIDSAWQASLPAETPHTCISVIGLSSGYLPQLDGGLARGIGKSCLCSRFVHPSYDDYWVMKEDHESCTSEAAFQSSEHCNVHSLYFGSVVKNVPRHGVFESSTCEQTDGAHHDKAVFHIVEHTVFVNQDSLLPLSGGEEDLYASRATSPGLPCVRQHAYIGQRFSELHPEKREHLPPIFNGLRAFVSGYLLVLDVARCNEEIHLQLEALEDILLSISAQRHPHRVALALTKCDAVSTERLQEVRDLVQHQLVTVAVFEVSARRGVGIDAPFFFIFRSAKSDTCLNASLWSIPYSLSQDARQLLSSQSERSLRMVLRQKVTSFSANFDSILQMASECVFQDAGGDIDNPLVAVLFFLGKDRCKTIVQQHLLHLKAVELCDRAKKELVQAMNQHPDFTKDDIRHVPM